MFARKTHTRASLSGRVAWNILTGLAFSRLSEG